MRAHTTPILVHDAGAPGQSHTRLTSVPLVRGHDGFGYDEAWLQALIHAEPQILPVDELEPALADLVPVCRELRVPSGFVDNLLLTPDGGIVLVEAKLWRNPQARREVVGQVLDYAKDLAGFDYEKLQSAVRLALRKPDLSLFDLVHPGADAAEERGFVDAVSRNLRLGRVLLLIVGDGIQEGVETLTDYLQRHMALSFTLALVELALWRAPEGALLVTPRILTRTREIERAVVRLEAGVAAAPIVEALPASASRPTSLTQQAFDEQLAQVDPSLPARLHDFVDSLEPLGVTPELKSALRLYWGAPNGRRAIVAAINADGRVYTDAVHSWQAGVGSVPLSDAYKRDVAEAAPGGAVEPSGTPMGLRLLVNGRTPTLGALLSNPDGWRSAIAGYVSQLAVATGA